MTPCALIALRFSGASTARVDIVITLVTYTVYNHFISANTSTKQKFQRDEPWHALYLASRFISRFPVAGAVTYRSSQMNQSKSLPSVEINARLIFAVHRSLLRNETRTDSKYTNLRRANLNLIDRRLFGLDQSTLLYDCTLRSVLGIIPS